jgi:hypothetical protein
MGVDGETQVSMVSSSVKARKSTQNSLDWSFDRSTCEHRWGVQPNKILSY